MNKWVERQRNFQRNASDRTKLTKTEWCRFYKKNMCQRGAQCSFAHATGELQPRPDFYRTLMCKTVISTGVCQNQNCSFAHNQQELRIPVCGKRDGKTWSMCPPGNMAPESALLPRAQVPENRIGSPGNMAPESALLPRAQVPENRIGSQGNMARESSLSPGAGKTWSMYPPGHGGNMAPESALLPVAQVPGSRVGSGPDQVPRRCRSRALIYL